MICWADFNPLENVYNFSLLDNVLTAAKERDLKVVLRLKGLTSDQRSPYSESNRPFIPQWVLEKHSPAEFYTYQDDPYYIKVVAPWDAGVHSEYHRFLLESGIKNYLSNDTLAGIYVHGFSTSFGEELWLDSPYLTNALNAGMTEENLMTTFEDRIDWWVEIAQNYTYKLAWVHYGWFPDSGYNKSRLNEYALNKGLGVRDGGLEDYHRNYPPDYDQNYANGYISTNFNSSLRSDNPLRFYGDEVENTLSDFSSSSSLGLAKYFTESSLMRSAQLGLNYLWTSSEFVSLSPAMFKWWTLNAGKGPSTSPDATCWLREDYFQNSSQIFTWKNFERFLFQRDFADSMTKPVLKIDRPALDKDPDNQHYDYSARSTDIINNQKSILFFLDPQFKTYCSLSFQIKVTYFDNSVNEWNLQIPTTNGTYLSESIIGIHDNTWKTKTFSFSSLIINNTNNPHHNDFSLHVLHGNDLTVRFVRFIKNA